AARRRAVRDRRARGRGARGRAPAHPQGARAPPAAGAGANHRVRSGLVALVGRPNAGKSTLLNRYAGQKVAIVSDQPPTTRHRIRAVRNLPGGQIVFIDTPGIHKPMHRMNERMVSAARDTLREVDLVVLVVDVSVRPGTGDRFVLDLLRDAGTKAVLVL